MISTLDLLKGLVKNGEVRISMHGYEELAVDNISVRNVVSGLPDAELLEDYPNFSKGPCVLVLQRDQNGQAIHVVWGISKGTTTPAVLVTAYRPDPKQWTADFRSRKR